MESEKNTTAAVVVTWNRKDLLRQNIQCLLAQEGAECDILIFDNASTDGTAEMVESEFDDARLKYFNTGANLGGAGGFHVGIYQAVMLGYDYVWIMDDDSLPEPNALSELFRAGKNVGDWGFLSSAVYWTDGSLCEANRPKKDLFRHVGDKDLAGGPVPIRMGSFVSMLVRSDVIREVGLPIAEYFIWTDDYEFSGRISKLYPCYFVPRSRVTHAMASNTRANLVTASGDRAGRFRNLYRNDVHCYRQHGVEGLAYLAAKGAYTAADVILHAETAKRERLQALFEGYRDGLRFHPAVVHAGDHKTKVLIYTDGWGSGGIESFVMGLLRNIDREKFEVSIFSPWDAGDDWLGDELHELGVRRYTLQSGSRPSNIKRGVLDLRPFTRLFDLSSFDVFHANTTTVVGLAYCRAAKSHGVQKVIAHSHSSSYGSGGAAFKAAMHSIGQRVFNNYVDVRLACSKEAGEYLYGGLPFEVIRNGIDTTRFRFDAQKRAEIRSALGIEPSCFLVGSIGRLAEEKDPIFQLKVFKELQQLNPSAKYLMVGSGPLEDKVEATINELALSESVVRVPVTKSPEMFYSALDVFLFPSVFEGLSIAAVEAQCSGLPMLASDHLPYEIGVTDLVKWKSKGESPLEWARSVISIQNDISERVKYADQIADAGFSAVATAEQIMRLYSSAEVVI